MLISTSDIKDIFVSKKRKNSINIHWMLVNSNSNTLRNKFELSDIKRKYILKNCIAE